jgi:hypothetical protein
VEVPAARNPELNLGGTNGKSNISNSSKGGANDCGIGSTWPNQPLYGTIASIAPFKKRSMGTFAILIELLDSAKFKDLFPNQYWN